MEEIDRFWNVGRNIIAAAGKIDSENRLRQALRGRVGYVALHNLITSLWRARGKSV
jgi:hypothetical protein